MTLPRLSAPLAAALAACILAGPAAAQALSGRVTDDVRHAPAPGVLVVLLDAAGGQKAGALTDAEGRFSLAAPAAGRWRVRAERVGRATAFAGPYDLAAGQTQQVALALHPLAIALDAIVVEARRGECTARPQEGERTQALWEEARKALNATAWSESRDAFRVRATTYERDVDVRTLRVRKETREDRTALARQLFAAVPAESLADNGYVRTARDGSATYYAPDAAVLLSDTFLDGHCMRVRAGEGAQAALIGLAFEPVRGHGRPDVEGVLWMDRASAELRFLEYRYVRMDPGTPTEGVGGRVEFDRLPTGEWMVRRWWVRMPVVEALVTGGRAVQTRLKGLHETGGEILSVAAANGAPVRAARGAALSGVVFDSARGRPLAGAEVFVSGTQYHATSDSAGRFRMEGVPAGEYGVSFSHPRLDSAGAVPPVRAVTVGDGDVDGVALALPPQRVAAAPARPPTAATVAAADEKRPLAVPGVSAQARQNARLVGDFYRRAANGGGRYITRAEIDRLRARTALELFRGVPSAEVVGGSVRFHSSQGPVPTGQAAVPMSLDAGSNSGVGGMSSSPALGTAVRTDASGDPGRKSDCVPAVYVDGTRWDPASADLAGIRAADVEGVEIYARAALAPAQYRRLDQDCAVILVWMREQQN